MKISIRQAFVGTDYRISDHPTDLKRLYESVQLSEETLSQIFNPDAATMRNAQSRGWGVSPDFSITNVKTGKILFGEIKRQDGWVEGKDPSAGRGNAHERMRKLFTPGLMKAYRQIGKITNLEILPFWVDQYDKNFFMWRPGMSGDELVRHFITPAIK